MKTFVFAPPEGNRLCLFPWKIETPLFLPRRPCPARGVSLAAVYRVGDSQIYDHAWSKCMCEVAMRFNSLQRPALSYERRSRIASALVRHQKMRGPFKHRLITRRTAHSTE